MAWVRDFPGTEQKLPAPSPAAVEVFPLPPAARRVNGWNAILEQPPVITMGLIAACAAMLAVTSAQGGLEDPSVLCAHGAKVAERIARGEGWRVVTANFLHGGLTHLLCNAIGLLVLGRMCENIFGRSAFLALVVATGISAQGLSTLLVPAVSVGISGPIFGILGALIAFHVRHRSEVPPMHRGTLLALVVWTGWSLASGFFDPEMDNWAHTGGLLGGLVLGGFIPAPQVSEGTPPCRRRVHVIMGFAATGVVVLSCTLQVMTSLRPRVMVAYLHLPGGFRIDHPDDWTVTRLLDQDSIEISDHVGGRVFVGRMDRWSDDLGENTQGAVRTLVEGLAQASLAGMPGFVSSRAASRSVDAAGRTWFRLQASATATRGQDIEQRIDATYAGGHVYFVIAVSPKGAWQRYRPAFDRILSSFELP
ncbi:MAG: rhomboid family intramembrane serine protease [Deltaproteobacteria bacterium]|nr:rhomboid family intramembrane serine protease [Deltaproteobacteria bacterium]